MPMITNRIGTGVRFFFLLVPATASQAADAPAATVRPAERYLLPGVPHADRPGGGAVDCNSPAHWDGDTLYVLSSEGAPWRASGPDLMRLDRKSQECKYDNKVNGG